MIITGVILYIIADGICEENKFRSQAIAWEELPFSKARLESASLDMYGGLRGSDLEATGFFYVTKTNGGKFGDRWWLVTPEGNVYINLSVLAPISYGMCGYFGTEPNVESILSSLRRKYGSRFQEPFFDEVFRRIATWGFNSVAMSSGVPLESAWAAVYDEVNGRHVSEDELAIYKAAGVDIDLLKKNIQKYKGYPDPYYYKWDPVIHGFPAIDNEAPLAVFPRNRRMPYTIQLFSVIWAPVKQNKVRPLIPGNHPFPDVNDPLYEKLVDEGMAAFFKRNKGIENDPWLIGYTLTGEQPYPNNAPELVEKFWRIITAALRKYDKNHMILGGQDHTAEVPPQAREIQGRYCDLVSIDDHNFYLDEEVYRSLYEQYKKPIIITEFGVGLAAKTEYGNSGTLDSQRERAECYKYYVGASARWPFMVGYWFYNYFDYHPKGGFHGSDWACGLVNYKNEPWQEFVDAVSSINRNIYRYALQELPEPAIPERVSQIKEKMKAVRGMEKYKISGRSVPIVINGDLNEWQPDKQFGIQWVDIGSKEQRLPYDVDTWKGKEDGACRVALLWDEKDLFVAATVMDDSFVTGAVGKDAAASGAWMVAGVLDHLEIFFAANLSEGKNRNTVTKEDYHLSLRPVANAEERPHLIWFWIDSEGVEAKNSKLQVKPADPVKDGFRGYFLEARIPWENFGGYRPEPGTLVGLDFQYEDKDEGDTPTATAHFGWHGVPGLYKSPAKWGYGYFQ